MPAYIVVDSEVTDPERFAEYRERATAAVEAHGGRYIARGGAIEPLEGDWAPSRITLLEFPDLETVRRFYDSPEYRHARDAREGAATFRMVATEGV